ncbi:Platinum sensitivity protein [Haplosporangium gracile]|nr:Platinum sensitivity protein [Haplosporangium gracile]
MRVHSSTNDDRVLDSIKQKTDDSVLSLSEDHTELGQKLQESDEYSDVWNAINDFPQEYYVNGVFSLPADEPSSSSLLPNPSITNLKEIEAILGAMGTDEEEQLPDFIATECYIEKLVSVLKICENADLLSSLHILRAILVHLIQLGDQSIVEEVIKDETFEGCIGILEYEPDLLNEKPHYRLIYSQRANFKEVMPFNDTRVVSWIHQVFRLQFIKDVALIRHLEEGPKSMLESFINRRSVKIIQNLLSDRLFLKELFDLLKDTSTSLDRRQDVVLFMHQFCSMAKKMGGGGIYNIYRRLFQLGLFTLIEFAFASDCTRVKQTGTDILLMALEDSSGSIRTHIVEQAKDKSNKAFFDSVITQFLTENDANLMPQLTEIIKILVDIDPESADDNGLGLPVGGPFSVENSSRLDPDADQFLDLFYTQYCSTLVAPILQLMKTSTSLDRPSSARCASICMLMSFLIRQHPTRTKVLLSSSRLVEKICILLKNKEKHMRLMAIKFFRTCLDLEDDYFNRILIKNKVIHGVVSVLEDTNGKNGLLNSVCLEFFSFIRDKNNRMLVSHCATVHRKTLEEIGYTSIFKNLLALHENGGNSSSGSGDGGVGMPGSSLKTLWGSQSRLFPGMRLPLFPGPDNDGKVDSGVEMILSNHLAPHMLQSSEPDDVEMADTTVVEEELSAGKPAQTKEASSATAGSPSLLSPLPSVALRLSIDFLKAGEGKDESRRQGTDIDTAVIQLKSELATESSDSGAEPGLVIKRKRKGEDDSDLGDADARGQPRLKLDAVVPETIEQPLSEDRNHSSSPDNINSLGEHSDASDSNSETTSGDFGNISDDTNSALTADNNITIDQSNSSIAPGDLSNVTDDNSSALSIDSNITDDQSNNSI